MSYDDVTFTVDVEQFLSLDDEYNDDLYERCEDDITCVFDEMIGDGDINKPSFSPDERWYPDVDEKNFNEILECYSNISLNQIQYLFYSTSPDTKYDQHFDKILLKRL